MVEICVALSLVAILTTVMALFMRRASQAMTESSARATLSRTALLIKNDFKKDFESTTVSGLSLPFDEAATEKVVGFHPVASVTDRSELLYSTDRYVLYHWKQSDETAFRHELVGPLPFTLDGPEPIRLLQPELLAAASSSTRINRTFKGVRGLEFGSVPPLTEPNIGLPIRLKLILVLPQNDRFRSEYQILLVPRVS